MNFLDRIFFKKFLQPEEEVIYIIHKHWWSVVSAAGKFIILALIFPSIVLWLYWHPVVGTVLAVWIIYVTSLFLQDFIDWYYDSLLITHDCVISIDWHGFFHSQTKRLEFSNVDGIDSEIKGMIPTFFQFGNLIINGSHTELKLEMVPRVRDWQKRILAKKEEIEANVDPTDDPVNQLKNALQTLLTVAPENEPISFNVKAHQVMIMKQKELKKKK